MSFSLPDLPYAYDALEPFIDTETMTIHHTKHHATYVANINKALEGQPATTLLGMQETAISAGIPAVRNNGGGHYNHSFFWTIMAPPAVAAQSKPSEQLAALIDKSFGSLDQLKSKFDATAAPGVAFGSSWVWLCVNAAGDALTIVPTSNQDNPLMAGACSEIMFPILGLDLWEHAYYLKVCVCA
jgi:superoxide dismutase, Fe-Mn family